jgi:hypothetical protein
MDRSRGAGRRGGRSHPSSAVDPLTGRAVAPKPEITGPETANTAGPAPEFRIAPGRNSYFAVEVAVDPSDLDGSRRRGDLPATRFYGSWSEGLQAAEGASTTYTLPQGVWQQIGPAALERGGRLYYRLITASAPDQTWPDMETSLPDGEPRRAPGVDVWFRPDRVALGAQVRPEEALWRDTTS